MGVREVLEMYKILKGKITLLLLNCQQIFSVKFEGVNLSETMLTKLGKQRFSEALMLGRVFLMAFF